MEIKQIDVTIIVLPKKVKILKIVVTFVLWNLEISSYTFSSITFWFLKITKYKINKNIIIKKLKINKFLLHKQ